MQGDCNVTIDGILAGLADVAWAPTFAFVDQQAAEVHWETFELAAFRRDRKHRRKAEIWILMSPTMILKGVRGTNNEAFQERVDRLYGGGEWRQIQRAFDQRKIIASDYRQQMVNLMRMEVRARTRICHHAPHPDADAQQAGNLRHGVRHRPRRRRPDYATPVQPGRATRAPK